MATSKATKRHLGFTAEELAVSPYARFFNPELAPLPEYVKEALLIGGQASELFPPVECACDLQASGYFPVETGYAVAPDGAVRICVHTIMPRVTPVMWDWWFAWHGCDGDRYKLWHPRAHVDVAWADGRDDLEYIGRTSNVVEYIGPKLFEVAIRFVTPATVGFDEQRLRANGEVAICARAGIAGAPILTGWLVHHIRPIPGGSEMRTRIWMGGDNVRPTGMPGAIGGLIGRTAYRFQPLTIAQINELIVHDTHEMNHLAGFLPELYAAFGPNAQQNSKGRA
jgi:hypothetical protein